MSTTREPSDTPPPRARGQRPQVALLPVLVVVTVNALLWLCSIPFQHGPDEGAHFQVVRFLRDHGRLPWFHPSELWLIRTPSGAVETYATFPPLAYVAAALASAPLRDDALWPARLASLAACLGTVVVTYRIARQLVPRQRAVATTAALTLGLLPQFAFTAAYVNNDALAVFESALLYALLLRAARAGPGARLYLGIGATVGSILLTKYTFYAAGLVGGLVALYLARDLRRSWRAVGSLVVATVATAGWWFVRNWQLYGELIPSRTVAAAKAAAGGNILVTPSDHGVTLLTLSVQTDFWAVTLRSFVATFGYLSIYLDGPYYLALLAFALAGAVGLAYRVWGRRHEDPPGRSPLAVLLIPLVFLAGATVLSAMAISTYGEYSPQGRYLFALLVPVAIALAVGWHGLAAATPLLRWLPGAAVAGMGLLSLISLLGYVVPRDFGAGPERIVVEVDRPIQPQPAGAEIEVLGWSFAQGAIPWRPLTPAVVNEYRRPVSGILIYLDGPPGVGAFQGVAFYGFRRRDVSEFYGGNRRLDPIGFRYVLPPGALAPGEHRLHVCALSATIETPVCATRAVTVIESPPG